MPEARRGLPSAFAAREQIESSLNDLEARKADGSIDEESYQASVVEYRQRLNAVDDEIEDIRAGLRKQLESNRRDREECGRSLDEVRTRHEAGELPADEYQNSTRELEEELQELETDGKALERLLQARSSSDLGVVKGKQASAGPEAAPAREKGRTRRVDALPEDSRDSKGSISERETPRLSAEEAGAKEPSGEPDVELGQALTERDEARRLLDSVEHLEVGGSITEEHREAARGDYEARLARAEQRVRDARPGVSARIDEVSQELSKVREEEALLDVRQKVGEYDAAGFARASASLSGRRAALEAENSRLQSLLAAETGAAAAAVLARKDKPVAGGTRSKPATARHRSIPEASPGAEQAESKGGFLARLTAGPKSNVVGLGAGAVLAVVLLVMIVRMGLGFFGGPGLPSPSLPSSGNGGSSSESGATAPGEFDEQTPTNSGAGSTAPTTTGNGEVPLTVQGASEVGSLHVEMVYDASSLELVSVQWGQLPSDALYEYATQPGRVSMGIVAPSGLGASQSLAVVSFRTVQASVVGQSPLYLENVVAHHSSSLAQMQTAVSSGSVDLATITVTAPTITVGGQ